LESLLNTIRNKITKAYRHDQNFKEILTELKNKIENLTFDIKEKQGLKEEMKQQIQKLAQL
jgi:archaellum component FlaC